MTADAWTLARFAGAILTFDMEGAPVTGPVRINDCAMMFQEIATNSAEYGTRSGGGTLTLTGHLVGDAFRLIREDGAGPPAPSEAEGTGFGSRLLMQTI